MTAPLYYGSIGNVEVLATTWTNNGHFLDVDIYDIYSVATTPSLMQVEWWMIQMTATVDLALAVEGLVTPLTNPTAVAAVSAVVEGVVADLCHAAHKSGRFFTKSALDSGISPMRAVMKELNEWVAGNAIGLRTLGTLTVKNAVGDHTASLDVL